MTQTPTCPVPQSRGARAPGLAAACGSVVAALVLAGCSTGGSTSAAAQPSQARTASPLASSPAASPSPSTLPAGVLASIHLDFGAAPLAAVGGLGSVWVASHRGSSLYRLDPATNTIQQRITFADGQCAPPVFGASLVLVSPCSPTVAVVDPTTNQVVNNVSGVYGAFTVVDGVPWAVTPSSIASLDPLTNKITRSITVVDANPRHVSNPGVEAAYGDGAFWAITVADNQSFGGSVVKIDAKTGTVDHVYLTPDPGGYADIQFLDHAVWLKGDDSGRLVKLDAATGKTHVYNLPGFQPLTDYFVMAMGVGMGDLWIRLSSGSVSRFDPVTGTVVAHYPADSSAKGGYVSVYDGSLWVANFDSDTVWRDKIT
jgi:streptogramin lyase